MTTWRGKNVDDDIVLSTLVKHQHFVAVAALEKEREGRGIDYEAGVAALRAAPIVPEPEHGPEVGTGRFR